MAKSSGNWILHAVGVRYNVKGSGTLETNLFSQDQASVYQCPDITLNSTGTRFPFVIANFRNQRIQIEFRINEIDDYFVLSDINLFVKPTASGYPQ